MKKAVIALAFVVPLLFASIGFRPAFAHTEKVVGDIRLEVGWGIEPPLVGQLNTIVISVSHVSDDKPITNAFASAEVTVNKGGESKTLSVLPGEEAGLYVAELIPTQLGQYAITVSGTIAGQQVDAQIEVEDVEDTSKLNFPQSSGDSGQGIPQDFMDQMRALVTDLQSQTDDAKTAAQSAADSAKTATETKVAADRAYLVGIVGIGAGITGIAIAAVALRRS